MASTVPGMAEKGWTSQAGAAAGIAAGAGAAQLGLGYGLGVIEWPSVATASESTWLNSLGWATWITASATVLGAVIAGRLRAERPGPWRTLWRVALATAASLGALISVALVALPARSAVRPTGLFSHSPQLVAVGYALIGLVTGVVVAFWAISSAPVAANLLGTAGWLWALAVAGVVAELLSNRDLDTYLTSWQFAETETPIRYGGIYWPSAVLTLAAAFLIGLILAFPAARRGQLGLGTATSGAVGPLLVAISFLSLAPLLTDAAGPLQSAYLIAPYAVLAGLAGSALTVSLAKGPRGAARRANAPLPLPAGADSEEPIAGGTAVGTATPSTATRPVPVQPRPESGSASTASSAVPPASAIPAARAVPAARAGSAAPAVSTASTGSAATTASAAPAAPAAAPSASAVAADKSPAKPIKATKRSKFTSDQEPYAPDLSEEETPGRRRWLFFGKRRPTEADTETSTATTPETESKPGSEPEPKGRGRKSRGTKPNATEPAVVAASVSAATPASAAAPAPAAASTSAKAATPASAAPKSPVLKPTGPKPAAPKPVGPGPVTPKPINAEPVAPKPTGPAPVAPKPITPAQVAPKPREDDGLGDPEIAAAARPSRNAAKRTAARKDATPRSTITPPPANPPIARINPKD